MTGSVCHGKKQRCFVVLAGLYQQSVCWVDSFVENPHKVWLIAAEAAELDMLDNKIDMAFARAFVEEKVVAEAATIGIVDMEKDFVQKCLSAQMLVGA